MDEVGVLIITISKRRDNLYHLYKAESRVSHYIYFYFYYNNILFLSIVIFSGSSLACSSSQVARHNILERNTCDYSCVRTSGMIVSFANRSDFALHIISVWDWTQRNSIVLCVIVILVFKMCVGKTRWKRLCDYIP